MAAAAEVTDPSGQVIMVKTEDGGCRGNNHRRLQQNGVNHDSVGTATTVLAIETYQTDCDTDGAEIEYGYPITCGDSRAVLLFKKFVCPGINVRCVKFNDQLISPKQFVHLAGKATLKDWKRAIRVGGVMLRRMMDSGQIDFYQHASVCSGTCRCTRPDVQMSSTRPPPGTLPQSSPLRLAQLPTATAVTGDAVAVEEPSEEMFGAAREQSNDARPRLNSSAINGHPAKIKRDDSLDGVLGFWRSVAESGLMGDVLSGLYAKVRTALEGMELRSEKGSVQKTDAHILNSLCETFGLLDSVKQALDLRCSQKVKREIHHGVHVLDVISQECRKQSCSQSGSHRSSSLKHPRTRSQRRRPLHTSPLNDRMNTVIHHRSFTGLSAASHAQVSGHFSAPAGRGHLVRASRTDEVDQSGNERKDTSGKERRDEVEDAGDGQIRFDEAEKTKGLYGKETFK